MRKQLQSLSNKIGRRLQLGSVQKHKESEPKIISQQCVVKKFRCYSCDMNYIGYTNRLLHQRVAEHSSLKFSIGKHMHEERNVKTEFD